MQFRHRRKYNPPKRYWGLDLGGQAAGGSPATAATAGGVGGLLATFATKSSPATAGTETYYYHYDANGNVTETIDSNGDLTASYEYGPFGELVSKSGSYSAAEGSPDDCGKNTYKFSTKPQDSETDHYYYGFRYYDPVNGRWLNRDPLGEIGGFNVYGVDINNFINLVDLDGQMTIVIPIPNFRRIGGQIRNALTNALSRIRTKRRRGSCSPSEHDLLQNQAEAACKGQKFRCTGETSCDNLLINRAQANACAKAQEVVNRRCFSGGNSGHRTKALLARIAAKKCNSFFQKKCAKKALSGSSGGGSGNGNGDGPSCKKPRRKTNFWPNGRPNGGFINNPGFVN